MKTSAICAISPDVNKLNIFGIGTDQAMYLKNLDGGSWLPSPTDWYSLGSEFNSAPAVAFRGTQFRGFSHVDVFGLDLKNEMNHNSVGVDAWPPALQAWSNLGGVFNSLPIVSGGSKVALDPANRLDVIGLGTNNSLYRKFLDDSGWHPGDWEPQGGVFIFEPAIAFTAPNAIHIVGVGTDGQMYHRWLDDSGWHPLNYWDPSGGCFFSAPAIVSWGPNRIDVFGLGSDLRMFHRAWENGVWVNAGWEFIGAPPGEVFDSPPAAISWGVNRLDIVALGSDHLMYHKAWNPGWSPSQVDWEPLGGPDGGFNCTPVITSWDANRLDIACVGADGQMYHKAWAPGWSPSQVGWEPLGGTFIIPSPTPLPPLPSQIHFHGDLTFPEGIAVGGWADITLYQDGRIQWSGNFHGSGAFPYDCSVVCVVVDAKGFGYWANAVGHVGGTFSEGGRDL